MEHRSRCGRWPGMALLLLLLGACAAGDVLGPDAGQGIDGLVLLGPLCPVQTVEDPCPDRPYAAWITVRTASGRSLTRLRSGEDGRFRVGLRPGTYVLDPEAGNPFPNVSAQEVAVREGAFTEVVVNYDTGIR